MSTGYSIVHRGTGLYFLGFNDEGVSLWGTRCHHCVWWDSRKLHAETQTILLNNYLGATHEYAEA